MSRYAEFGLILIVGLVIGGCSNSEPETVQPASPSPTDASTPTDTAAADLSAEQSDAEAPLAETPSEEAKPTVLGAIGRAFVGVMGVSDDEEPSEAPAFRR